MGSSQVVENRIRRALERRGLKLQRSRRRDPKARDFGGCQIVDPVTKVVVAGDDPLPFSMSLDEVELWLKA